MIAVTGFVLMCIGIGFAGFGVLGIFRFNDFYSRILVTSNIDAVAMLFVMTGTAIEAPSAAFALKVVIVLVLALITGPLSTHALSRSAYASGYRIK